MDVPWWDRRGRFLPLKAIVLVSLFVPGGLYAMWLAAVAILYLPSRWFIEFRSRHRDWKWLSYL